MGAKFTQANRPIAVQVEGLKPDTLLLVGFTGEDAISTLFHFHLDLLAPNPAQIPFEQLLGKSVTIELDRGRAGRPVRELKQVFNGICRRVAQGERDRDFTHFSMDIVPRVWRLTKIARSRIFQHLTVRDILEEVFKGYRKQFRNWTESVEKRDYCAQYRETDFNFAARLLAEEGIPFCFEHGVDEKGAGFHTLVMGNPPADQELDEAGVWYRKRGDDPQVIRSWEKAQELRAGKVTLRDHTFEMPDSTLEVNEDTAAATSVGRATHKLNSANTDLELYDFPGQYAKRIDGIDAGGGDQVPQQTKKIFPEGERLARYAHATRNDGCRGHSRRERRPRLRRWTHFHAPGR
jgi:type VI secretion system secreted protein VgrG